MSKILIVGTGISGSTIANLAANEGHDVTIIDRKDHIAGNCHDARDCNNIMIHTYGSHIFHTSEKKVWDFLSGFTSFNTYMHKVIGLIDGIETTIPFNFNTLHDVFPDYLADRIEKKLLDNFQYNTKIPIMKFMEQDDEDIRFLAEYVYEKIFLHYTSKQWGKSPDQVDGAVTARVPIYLSKDDRYFQDIYQGIPLNGYTAMIGKMLAHPKIEVKLNTEFTDIDASSFDHVFYTGAIDEYFGYRYGELPYRSVHFRMETYDREHYQAGAVVNYPCNYDFTRVHEYKYYLNDRSDKTVIAKEYSEQYVRGKNERYYPIPGKENEELYAKYLELASEIKNLHFLGRLGDYRYYDMDKAVLRAMNLYDEIFHKS